MVQMIFKIKIRFSIDGTVLSETEGYILMFLYLNRSGYSLSNK